MHDGADGLDCQTEEALEFGKGELSQLEGTRSDESFTLLRNYIGTTEHRKGSGTRAVFGRWRNGLSVFAFQTDLEKGLMDNQTLIMQKKEKKHEGTTWSLGDESGKHGTRQGDRDGSGHVKVA